MKMELFLLVVSLASTLAVWQDGTQIKSSLGTGKIAKQNCNFFSLTKATIYSAHLPNYCQNYDDHHLKVIKNERFSSIHKRRVRFVLKDNKMKLKNKGANKSQSWQGDMSECECDLSGFAIFRIILIIIVIIQSNYLFFTLKRLLKFAVSLNMFIFNLSRCLLSPKSKFCPEQN